jgi:DNA ligase-1
MATARGKREFVQLAESWDVNSRDKGCINIGHWWATEKMDGMRALWLPDTIGMPFGTVIFGNLVDAKRGSAGLRDRLCTGLWSRYGRPIWAPQAWIKKQVEAGVLHMDRALDGELWAGRGKHQRVMSIVKKTLLENISPTDWDEVRFEVFDSPRFETVYGNGVINNAVYKKEFVGVYDWMVKNNPLAGDVYKADRNRKETFEHLLVNPALSVRLLPGLRQLNWRPSVALDEVNAMMEDVHSGGGEGIIIRHGGAVWEPLRRNVLLKLKPFEDDEGVVIGYTDGEKRLEGTVGSVRVRWKNVEFSLSGFTDEQRELIATDKMCRVGEKITFRYRELSDSGVPKEARYMRPHDDSV